MQELDMGHTLDRVQAPPGFERMVLARVAEVRSGARKLQLRSFDLRLTLAGGLAALLACFILVNVFVLNKGRVPSDQAEGAAAPGTSQGQVIRVMDSVDYGQEVRNISGDPKTVYILEQVSDNGSYAGIIY